MLQYRCDWCQRTRKDGEPWIMGLAAEEIGVTAAGREVTIMSPWSERWARHPLAVHFCSQEHKEKFLQAFFHLAGAQPGGPKRRKAAGGGPGTATTSVAVARQQRPRSRRPQMPSQPAVKQRGRLNVERLFNQPDQIRAHGLGINLAARG